MLKCAIDDSCADVACHMVLNLQTICASVHIKGSGQTPLYDGICFS